MQWGLIAVGLIVVVIIGIVALQVQFSCRRRRYGGIPGVDVGHFPCRIIFLTAIIAVLLVRWQHPQYDEAPEAERYYRDRRR
ncbi:MAG: hypothetical protein LUQ34_02860 [Euryarchaeota archaeon]|nr:hypothetical protein [Euryarchaeota archaeon]